MVAISIGVLAVWAGINALRIDQVAWIMNVSSVWQVRRGFGFWIICARHRFWIFRRSHANVSPFGRGSVRGMGRRLDPHPSNAPV